MAAVRLAVLVAIAGCAEPAASPQPAWPEPPSEPGKVDAAPSARAGPEIAPPAECGKRTWRQCLSAAQSLIEQTPAYQEEGVLLYKLLCTEGDRRRCFEPDTPEDVRATCQSDGLVAACHELADLYRDGRATCPDDDRCAELLYRMACLGGEGLACLE